MKNIYKYLITMFIGLLLAFLVALSKNIFDQTILKNIYHILSDAFFVSGVLITGIGLLVFVSDEGVFDGLSYAVIAFLNMFKSKDTRRFNSLYEYKEYKHREKTRIRFLLISGLILLIIAVLFYILFANC